MAGIDCAARQNGQQAKQDDNPMEPHAVERDGFIAAIC